MENKKQLLANLAALVASLGIASVAPDAGLAMIMGNMGINLGSQYIYDTVNPQWQRLWKGKDGILNHDIQKALVLAIQEAYKQINEGYIKEHQLDDKEKEAIELFLTDLSSEAAKHLLSETAATDPVKAEELFQYLSFTNTQETYPQLAERLKLQTIQANNRDDYDLSENFLHFFKEHLAPLVKEEFVKAITDSPIAKTKIELLYFECLQQSVTQGNTQIMEAINELKTRSTTTDVYSELWVGAIRRFHDKLDKIEENLTELRIEVKKKEEFYLNIVKDLLNPERLQKVKDEFQKLPTTAEFPNILASIQFQKFNSEIPRYQKEFNEKNEDIADAQQDIEHYSGETEKERERKARATQKLFTLEVERLKISEKIENAQKELQNFTTDVLKLATFLSTSTGTQSPRLQQARQLFKEGKFEEANAALNETDIFEARKNLREQLENVAEEFLLKAKLTALNKSTANWFDEAKRFFEETINTYPSYNNCFECAFFLDIHKQHEQAIKYYEQALGFANNEIDRADTLNNLGLSLCDINELKKALSTYKEALTIYRSLGKKYPYTYLPCVAITLNNLASLYMAIVKFSKSEKAYLEALKIYRSFAKIDPKTYQLNVVMTLNNLGLLYRSKIEFPKAEEAFQEALTTIRSLIEKNSVAYLPNLAMILNNFGLLHRDKNEFPQAEDAFRNALAIYKSFVEKNPQIYLPDVATTLNNIGGLHRAKNEFSQAKKAYLETLDIYLVLADKTPKTYLRYVSMTATNLSTFYQKNVPDQALSLNYAKVALKAALPYKDKLPQVKQYSIIIQLIVHYWGLDPETFKAECMEELEDDLF